MAYDKRVKSLTDFVTSRVTDDNAFDVLTLSGTNFWYFADLGGPVKDKVNVPGKGRPGR